MVRQVAGLQNPLWSLSTVDEDHRQLGRVEGLPPV
jgi:hypothetical protein